MLQSISTPNFEDISKSTTDILLIPVSENKRLPYWNSTSGFDFDLTIVIVMSFCIRLSNFPMLYKLFDRSLLAVALHYTGFQAIPHS